MNRVLALAAAALASSAAVAQTFDYNEFVDGDLSNDIMAPTNLGVAGVGQNNIRLEIFDSASPTGDFDVFTFTIADGQELAQILLTDYVGVDTVSYIAFDDGNTFPTNPNTGDPFAFLGGALFGPDNQGIGGDLLPDLQLPQAGGVGFSGPVGPGDYTIFIQQTGALTEVGLGLVVVPAPASLAALAGLGLVVSRRRR